MQVMDALVMLSYPDLNEPYILYIDAAGYAFHK